MKCIFAILVIFAVAAPALGHLDITAETGVGGAAKKKGGPLAQLVEVVVITVQGVVDGLAPVVGGLLAGVIPLVRAILDLLEIHVCKPATKTELILFDVIVLYNTRLVPGLHLPEIKGLCKPNEVACPDAAKRLQITGKALPGAGPVAALTGYADLSGDAAGAIGGAIGGAIEGATEAREAAAEAATEAVPEAETSGLTDPPIPEP